MSCLKVTAAPVVHKLRRRPEKSIRSGTDCTLRAKAAGSGASGRRAGPVCPIAVGPRLSRAASTAFGKFLGPEPNRPRQNASIWP